MAVSGPTTTSHMASMAYPKWRAAAAALTLFSTGAQAIDPVLAAPTPQPVLVQAPLPASQHGPASAVIDKFDGTLLGVMKQADRLGYDGRAKELRPAIEQAFNIPLMTRIIV